MIKFRNLAVIITVLGCFFIAKSADTPKTVAVLYFENNSLTDKDKYDGLKKGLCDIMITYSRELFTKELHTAK